jgi:aminoglycoside phosphotransferase (APT) family kinase protein
VRALVPPTSLPGFPTRQEMAQRYAERTGRDLSKLDFYIGFNRWKSAAIVHGVYSRYMEGKKSTEGVDMEGLKRSILRSLEQSEAAIERLEKR